MADLYYYGAHGLPRDQPRALRYFEQAAAVGDPTGQCGAAGMYLKGEGAPANVTRAIELYENASTTGSIRALNGLGYMYFFGQSVEKNQTKALEYFLAAAVNETDADSLFNAAHCLENGLGAAKDLPRAVKLYTVAANKLGNFNSIHVLANMYLEVKSVFFRSCFVPILPPASVTCFLRICAGTRGASFCINGPAVLFLRHCDWSLGRLAS